MTEIENFTIQNGSPGISGGGGKISNCIIKNNEYGFEGTGSLDIVDCIIDGNNGTEGAAIKWTDDGNGTVNVLNTVISNNTSYRYPAFYKINNNSIEYKL